jgi:hypothetical protein
MKSMYALLILLAVAFPLSAQPEPEVKNDRVTISMSLSPALPPKPISQAYLFPQYGDSRPGNRVFGLIKSFMEQDAFYRQEPEEQRQKWLQMPLSELPANVRELAGIASGIAYRPKYASMMVRVDLAARYTQVEWDEWFDLRKDGVFYLLPEVQKLRTLANVVRLRMRGEVKNHEFDKAVESAKTLLGIAQALEQHPTLIGFLVGVAIAAQAQIALEEMIQQPGCPNLYWSFSDLPSPVLSIRNGTQGERVFHLAQFDALLKADHVLSEEELNKIFQEIKELSGMAGNGSATGGNKLIAFLRQPKVRYQIYASDEERVAEGRKTIIARGFFPDLVNRFSPLQVVVTNDFYRFEELRDELFKWINLPYPQAKPGMEEMEKLIVKELTGGASLLSSILLPSAIRVKETEIRCDQRFALLRTIEAIRLHATQHDGKLPESLKEIDLPVPMDPVTGKPFQYSVKDSIATLHGANMQSNNPRLNRHYEIRIRKE